MEFSYIIQSAKRVPGGLFIFDVLVKRMEGERGMFSVEVEAVTAKGAIDKVERAVSTYGFDYLRERANTMRLQFDKLRLGGKAEAAKNYLGLGEEFQALARRDVDHPETFMEAEE